MTFKWTIPFVLLAILAACQAEGTYPITGEECRPDDPVQELATDPCPPGTGSGTF